MRCPFIEWKLRRDWEKKHREWILGRYYASFKRSSLAINTSFQLTSTERNVMARIVNTRTSDMEFSPTSEYLAVASNCIKGGYISVVKAADFDKKESLLYSFFNTERTKSTQDYFKVFYSKVVVVFPRRSPFYRASGSHPRISLSYADPAVSWACLTWMRSSRGGSHRFRPSWTKWFLPIWIALLCRSAMVKSEWSIVANRSGFLPPGPRISPRKRALNFPSRVH